MFVKMIYWLTCSFSGPLVTDNQLVKKINRAINNRQGGSTKGTDKPINAKSMVANIKVYTFFLPTAFLQQCG
ncbi:hypothetical protein GCM10009415_27020 [Chitinophaga japonensis]